MSTTHIAEWRRQKLNATHRPPQTWYSHKGKLVHFQGDVSSPFNWRNITTKGQRGGHVQPSSTKTSATKECRYNCSNWAERTLEVLRSSWQGLLVSWCLHRSRHTLAPGEQSAPPPPDLIRGQMPRAKWGHITYRCSLEHDAKGNGNWLERNMYSKLTG